jgi:MinD-like ATPase involved in chromosome partitioning or flagellar assembly
MTRAQLPPVTTTSAVDDDHLGLAPPVPPQPPPGETDLLSSTRPRDVDWLRADTPLTGQAADLNETSLLGPVPPAPDRGWRRALQRISRGAVNPGISAAQRRRIDLVSRIRTPNPRCQRIAVVSLKGGIGKTTTVGVLGGTLAAMRADRVVAVDANPDGGTLAARLTGGHGQTGRTLLAEAPRLGSYAQLRSLLEQAPSRLHVLAGDQDPAVSQAFNDADYRSVSDILGRYYDIMLTDSGTGLLHSAVTEVLDLADILIVVGSVSVDGAKAASRTLDWLDAHAYGRLARNAHVVLSGLRPGGRELDTDRIVGHFQARCGSVFTIPFDPHLAAGGTISLDALRPATRAAYLHLAAAVADGFARE